jgi:NADPH-dependent curcumin reductase CurA
LKIIGGISDLIRYQFIVFKIRFVLIILFSNLNFPGQSNTKWVLKERPRGLVKNENFELIKEELRHIQDGEVLIENQYLSFDPTQRMWLTDLPGYLPPVQIDEGV